MKLAELQDYFQTGLLDTLESQPKSPEILDHLNQSDQEQTDILFGVYQNAYILRLIEFLQADYENLERYLGDEDFDKMARSYAKAHTSEVYNARWFGAQLPAFLTWTKPWSDLPQLFELAAFDRALMNSFDSKDAPFFTLEHMATIENWADLQLKPHHATSRLTLNTNASAIREALICLEQDGNKQTKPPEMTLLTEPEQWLFYRSEDLQSMYRLLTYEEAMMWDEMTKGANFGSLCEILAHYSSEEEAPIRAAGFLQGWINDRLLLAPK